MRNSVEQISHEQLLAWRNSDDAQLSTELKNRLEQYYTIHRMVLNSQSKTAIYKTISETYGISKTQFEYIYPLAISFFHSSSKLTKSDFKYILYEKMNKAVQAAWEARDIELYINAVNAQKNIVKELWEDGQINQEDLKQPVFLLVTDPKRFGYDRPTQKEIENEIDKMVETLDLTKQQVSKIKLDAGITDVSFEDVKENGSN